MRRAFPTMLAAALLLAAALPADGSAKDLGVRGATWPVAEPDLLAKIEARLIEMQRSGALARLQEEARASTRRKLEEQYRSEGVNDAEHEPGDAAGPCRPRSGDPRSEEGRQGGRLHARHLGEVEGRGRTPRRGDGMAPDRGVRPGCQGGGSDAAQGRLGDGRGRATRSRSTAPTSVSGWRKATSCGSRGWTTGRGW